MPHLFIFGLGYSAKRIASGLQRLGWHIDATGSDGALSFDDEAAVSAALGRASHVLSSVPPGADGDPVLAAYGSALAGKEMFYLSSMSVYGDTQGAWADETAPAASGRLAARNAADAQWMEMGARVFRLPGIYGPGRSAFDRIASGKAHRINSPGQVFSRIHVDDIASGVIAAIEKRAAGGAYNLADDMPCSQNAVIEYACALMGVEPPPLLTLDEAGLSPMARGFYLENRRIATGKAKRVLGWKPAYPTYREGLAAINRSAAPEAPR